ncbi:hypothetical protein BDY21DRAFT_347023, partial [Lineolata rhizophorae]
MLPQGALRPRRPRAKEDLVPAAFFWVFMAIGRRGGREGWPPMGESRGNVEPALGRGPFAGLRRVWRSSSYRSAAMGAQSLYITDAMPAGGRAEGRSPLSFVVCEPLVSFLSLVVERRFTCGRPARCSPLRRRCSRVCCRFVFLWGLLCSVEAGQLA